MIKITINLSEVAVQKHCNVKVKHPQANPEKGHDERNECILEVRAN